MVKRLRDHDKDIVGSLYEIVTAADHEIEMVTTCEMAVESVRGQTIENWAKAILANNSLERTQPQRPIMDGIEMLRGSARSRWVALHRIGN